MPPAILLDVMSLMWQHVLTTKGPSSCQWRETYERKYMQKTSC